MLVERRTRDWKVAGSNPSRSGERIVFSRVNLYVDSYLVSVPPRVTAVARKRPRPFFQKCRRQVTPKHAHNLESTKSEWADYAAVQACCGNLPGNELTGNLLENMQPQSSQVTEPLWTVSGR